MATTTVRGILAEQHGGISRAGLLAWCRLRIDPGMTEEQLAAELQRLGPDLIDDAGFLRLRPSARADEPTSPAPRGPADQSVWAAPVTGAEAATPRPPGRPDLPSAAPPTGATPGDAVPGHPAATVEAGASAVSSADAGRPFDWVPPNLDRDPVGTSEATVPGWEAPPSRMSRRSRALVIGGGLVAVIVLVGLASALGGGASTPVASPRPGSSGIAPGATMIGAFDLTVGDCVMEPQNEFDTIEWRPCAMAHEAEVFFIGDVPEPADGAFPGDDAFDAFMEQQCLPAFQEYTGSVYAAQAVLDVSWFAPTEESWANGDREVVCLLVPGSGGTTDRSWHQAKP
jgi:hypothetical protein